MLSSLVGRIQGRYRRTLSSVLCRRPIKMKNAIPLISFAFDDFPQTALEVGGAILNEYKMRGTYYISLGLLDKDTATGRICSSVNVKDVLAHGHELGCHTFAHCDAWETDSRSFEKSIVANRDALKMIIPEAQFLTMSYPIDIPRPQTKLIAGAHFAGCRGGGQRYNVGTIDLNYMHAFFLEKSKGNLTAIWELIERCREERGWLIFATHDVAVEPTKFGCTPEFFENVVSRAKSSGVVVLPVAQALSAVCGQAVDYSPFL